MKTFLHPISYKTRSWILFLTSLISLSLILGMFMFQSASLGGNQPLSKFLHILSESLILLIPFWFLPQRWRPTVFIPLFLLPIWCMGSLWYYRFWNDLPSVNSFLLISNVNSELIGSVAALWRVSDLWFLFPPVVTLCVYLLIPVDKNSPDYSPSKKTKLFIPGITLCVFVLSQVIRTRSYVIYEKGLNVESGYCSATINRLSTPPISVKIDMSINGWTVGTVKSLIFSIQLLNVHKHLSENDIKDIQSFIKNSPKFELSDSLRSDNRQKNVILIVVESLNSEVIGMQIDGNPVAPTLQSLIEADGTVSALDVVTQVRTGGSGDGQLIVNTGLLPLPLFSTALSLGTTNSFFALPESLGRNMNLVIFGDNASSWNERNSFSSYGFEEILCNKDYQKRFPGRSDDDALLQFAAQNLSRLKQPFFLELLTVSMHVPFQDDNIPSSKLNSVFKNALNLPESARSYLTMVNFFDKALGDFINNLKREGLFDNTILMVVSDHSQDIASSVGGSQSETPMVFIAANTGVTERIKRKVGQVDIFPTILDICGTDTYSWKGVGTTMLNPLLRSAYLPQDGVIGENTSLTARQQRAYGISEKILRGDYFKRQK